LAYISSQDDQQDTLESLKFPEYLKLDFGDLQRRESTGEPHSRQDHFFNNSPTQTPSLVIAAHHQGSVSNRLLFCQLRAREGSGKLSPKAKLWLRT
jgi:hypothetical protein